MADETYLAAVERRYLRAYPERAALLAALSTRGRADVLRRWPLTADGRRHQVADAYERLADARPTRADELRALARRIRAGLTIAEDPYRRPDEL